MNSKDFLNKEFTQYEVARVWAYELQNLIVANKAYEDKIMRLKNKISALEAQLANEVKAPFVRIYG